MNPPSSSTRLPLASFLASTAPQHPLPQLLVQPAIPRIARAEAALLTTRPAALLLRLGLASEASLVALALAALAGVIVRWRQQWRAIAWVLGAGEALARTVGVLRRLPARGAKRDPGKESAQDDEDSQDDDEEVQHVLAWWTLFALLSLVDSLRATSSPTSSSSTSIFALPSRLRASLRALRHTYLRFIRLYILPPLLRLRYSARQLALRYPRLDISPHLPSSPPFPSLFARRAVPPPRGSFPQPRLHASPLSSAPLPLPWSYFLSRSTLSASTSPAALTSVSSSAEKKWELVKLLLLWVGLRRDAWGAKSVLWDWVLEPFLGGAGGGAAPSVEIRALKPGEPFALPSLRDEPAPSRPSHDRPRPSPAQDDHSPLSATTPRRRALSPTPSSAPFAFPTPLAAARPDADRPPRPNALPTPISAAHPLIPLALPQPGSASSSRTRGRRAPGPASTASSSETVSRAPSLAAPAPAPAPVARERDRAKRDSLLFESPPRRVMHARGSSESSLSLSDAEGDGDRARDLEDEDEVPSTPGQEEAEEGARGWGSVLELELVRSREGSVAPTEEEEGYEAGGARGAAWVA
ncbi:hypothetical protein JCM10207_001365 [Rhodosporidiobolus poonsookiae]